MRQKPYNMKSISTGILLIALAGFWIIGCDKNKAPAPASPADLISESVTASSVELYWTGPNGITTGFDLYSNDQLLLSTTKTQVTVNELEPNTAYNFYVKAKGTNGSASGESNKVSITTLGALSAAWPDQTNTGVPPGITLTPTAGRTITQNNAVIANEDINGALIINAKKVIVRNCRIRSFFAKGENANGTGVIKVRPGASVTIERCTLDGQLGTHAAIWYEGDSLTARFNNCFNTNDGIFVWDANKFKIEDNFIHDLTTETSNGHIDGFQTEGASYGVIRHNTFDISQDQNACVAIWNTRRNSHDILVESNLMAGSGFAVYAQDYSPSEANPSGGYSVTKIRFVNNVFSTKYYGCVGYWGVWYPRGQPTDGWRRTGNYVKETNEQINNGNPHNNGQPCN